MSDKPNLPFNEMYELTKLRILGEVQNDLTTWARRRVWILILAVTLVAFFGVGGFISLTVSQGIEKKWMPLMRN